MRRMTRVGLFCAGIALLAPSVFADAIMLEGKTFSPQTEVFLIEVEHGHNGDDGGGFALEICKHCRAKGEGPFLFNPNLSQAAFSRDFFAPFSGVSSLSSTPTPTPPTALLTGSINAISTTTASTATSSSGAASSTLAPGVTTAMLTSGGVTTTTATTTSGGTSTTIRSVKDPAFAANPEPATVFLLGTGLVAGVISRRKLRRRS